MSNVQTIYRSHITSNFSVLPRAIPENENLSAYARLALIYLLGKPPTWKMRITDVKRAIGCGINKAYRCLNELIKAGYARMVRGQSRVDWFFYDRPQPRENTDRDGLHHDQGYGDIVNNEYLIITENNNAEPAIKTSDMPIVVVSDVGISEIVGNSSPVSVDNSTDGLTYPDKLTKDQRKQTKHVIKKCKPELKQDVLYALAYAMVQGTVKNPVAYLQGLIKSANNGLFTPVETNLKGKNASTLTERLEIERKRKEEAQKRLKVDNNKFFQMLKEKYGHSSTM